MHNQPLTMLSFALPLLLAARTTASPEMDNSPVATRPPKDLYMTNCMVYGLSLEQKHPRFGKQWASGADKVFHRSLYICWYSHIENKDTYTHNEFRSAQKQCADEYEEDHIRAMIKYLKIKELREKLDSGKNI